jgi:hypothetical protein
MQGKTLSYNKIADASSHIWFARASFLGGVARIFDFSGTVSEYNSSGTGEKADYDTLLSDWLAVGDDIRERLRSAEPSDRSGQLL